MPIKVNASANSHVGIGTEAETGKILSVVLH